MRLKTKINGTFIEDIIPSFATLNVEGLDSLTVISSKSEEKPVKITFYIKAESNEQLIICIDELKKLLINSEMFDFSFNTELDKYRVGTLKRIEVDMQTETVATGTIEVTLYDPFKYLIDELSFVGNDSLTISNNGGYSTPISYEIDILANTGYIELEHAGKALTLGRRSQTNRFRPGTKIRVDGIDRRIYVDGIPRASEEVLGSAYFDANVGQTQVNINTNGAVEVRAIVRPRWL